MNLILGTLAQLKAHLLNDALATDTQFDAKIAALGGGVARLFEGYCGRRFARVIGDTAEFSADQPHVVLPRFPVETVTKLELQASFLDAWEEQDLATAIEGGALKAGLIYLSSPLGLPRERIRITYTGGFWIDESDDPTVDARRSWQQGSVDLSADAEQTEITFPVEFASAPAVRPVVIPPEGGMLIQVVPMQISASGFTAKLGYPIPAAGYKLQWDASLVSNEAAPATLPTGATELPEDIRLAWLLQCERAWALLDKLGLNTQAAAEKPMPSLQDLELVPQVKTMLQPYRRLVSL